MFLKRANPSTNTTVITPYHRRHRQTVLQLIARTHRVHTHLDWYDTDKWLDAAGHLTWTAWHGARLVGVIGMSEPLKGASWVRLCVLDADVDAQAVMSSVWDFVARGMTQNGVRQVGLLILNDWIVPYAGRLGFSPYDEVITLQRVSMTAPDPEPSPFFVRSFDPNELNAIINIDLAAFQPPWMMSHAEIRQAERMAAHVSVALHENRAVGYQLSTLYLDGAHLARLAVLPEYHGRGVGRALLYDMIRRCVRRSVYAVTVNTQATNIHSQNLYTRAGFHRTGYNLPVYTLNL